MKLTTQATNKNLNKKANKKLNDKDIARKIIIFLFIVFLVTAGYSFLAPFFANNTENISETNTNRSRNNINAPTNKTVILSPVVINYPTYASQDEQTLSQTINKIVITERFSPSQIRIKKDTVLYFLNMTDDIFFIEVSNGIRIAIEPGRRESIRIKESGTYTYMNPTLPKSELNFGTIIVEE